MKKLLLLLFFISASASLFSQSTYEYTGTDDDKEHQTIYYIIGYNTFTPNYNKLHFNIIDSTQAIYLKDSIVFKRMNNTFRFGINPQFKFKNNLLLDFGMSFTMPILKHIQMNNYNIGIGYYLDINKHFTLKPLILLELNRYYYKLTDFDGTSGQNLYVNGKNMGDDLNIRYLQSSYGISPKVSFCYEPMVGKRNKHIALAIDYGYHFSLYEKESIQFKGKIRNSSSSNFIIGLIEVAFNNLTSKKVPAGMYLSNEGKSINKQVITASNIFFTFKIGYKF